MGRIFEKRKARMFARWSKTAKAFTKVGREIAVAVKMGGPDPSGNARLRAAIQTARSLNMPKDRIESAIQRASSKDEADLQEITYEGYGPYGVAIIVDTATNNPTRTVANVRSVFTRHEGALGTSGSLSFVFGRRGMFIIDAPAGDLEEFELDMIDFGLEDIFDTEEGLLLHCALENYGELQRALDERGIEVKVAAVQRYPLSTVSVTPAQEEEIEKFVTQLEDDDDVLHVYHNMKGQE